MSNSVDRFDKLRESMTTKPENVDTSAKRVDGVGVPKSHAQKCLEESDRHVGLSLTKLVRAVEKDTAERGGWKGPVSVMFDDNGGGPLWSYGFRAMEWATKGSRRCYIVEVRDED